MVSSDLKRILTVVSNPVIENTGPGRISSWDEKRFYDLRNIYEAKASGLGIDSAWK